MSCDNIDDEQSKSDALKELHGALKSGQYSLSQPVREKCLEALSGSGKDTETGPWDDPWHCVLDASACGGCMDLFQLLLQAGVSIDVTSNGFTSLWAATRRGRLKVMEMLVEAGANLDKACKLQPNWNSKQSALDGSTPLQAAIMYGHLEAARNLIEAGADVNKAAASGDTPIYHAAACGHVDMVRDLVKAGANVSRGRVDGATPLVAAAERGHLEVVRILLAEFGCKNSPVRKPAPGQPATSFGMARRQACGKGHANIVRYLLGASGGEDFGLAECLSLAAGAGHLEVAKVLVFWGVDKNGHGSQGSTPLYAAAENGHFSMVKFLVEEGADIDKYTPVHGRTALTAASSRGHFAVVNYLVGKGARVEPSRPRFMGPLGAACAHGQMEVIRFLIEAAGANPLAVCGTRGARSMTPLSAAASAGRAEAMEYLLAQGAKDPVYKVRTKCCLPYNRHINSFCLPGKLCVGGGGGTYI